MNARRSCQAQITLVFHHQLHQFVLRNSHDDVAGNNGEMRGERSKVNFLRAFHRYFSNIVMGISQHSLAEMMVKYGSNQEDQFQRGQDATIVAATHEAARSCLIMPAHASRALCFADIALYSL